MAVIFDLLGWAGALLVLTAYFLISTDKIDSKDVRYHILNLSGSIMLIVHTVYQAAYASAFVNAVWAGIAIVLLMKYVRHK